MTPGQKKAGAAGAGAIAVAVAILLSGGKIDCAPEATKARFDDFQDRFDGCFENDQLDRSCFESLERDYQKTIAACPAQEPVKK